MIVAYRRESIPIAALSLLFWILLFAQSLYIEVPYENAVEYPAGSGTVNVTTGAFTYNEYALSAVVLGVILFHIIMLIAFFVEYKKTSLRM